MRRNLQNAAVLAVALGAIIGGSVAPCAQAQRRVQLLDFTATPWRYETNGLDLGVAWRSPTFDDSGWPSGFGLLGVETTPEVYPYPFNTPFIAYDNSIITYYFRAHFDLAASNFIFPLTLVMSNLVDDGCVVYLNSNIVHQIRVPAGPTSATPATGGPGIEGEFVGPVNISTNSLRVGENVLAVEVHQTGAGSSDIVHGLSLTAIVPTALAITSQPPSQLSTVVGQSVVLSAGISGGPGLYQWQTNDSGAGTFVNESGATSKAYTFTPSAAGTRTFRLVASNGVNMVISSNATVTVVADTSGPLMQYASVLDEPARTNRIQIPWNERLLTSTLFGQSRTNFQVIMHPSNVQVAP